MISASIKTTFINDGYTYRLIHSLKTSSQAYDFPHHSNIGFLTDDNATPTSSRGGPLYEFLGTSIRILRITLRRNATGHRSQQQRQRERET